MTARVKLTIEEYVDEVLGLVSTIPDVETVGLAEASGRTLAEPVVSVGMVPAFDNSGMDGFAVRAEDLCSYAVLREVATVAAGSATDPAIGAGECVRIMTGAPVPSDADTVIQREHVTELSDGRIRIDQAASLGKHVRRAGEELLPGQEVIATGRRLDARTLSLSAAAGQPQVTVRRKPRVAVVSTGNELVSPGKALARGQIYESNSVYLSEAARADGADCLVRVLPDEPDAFKARLTELARETDLVVLSGGVSVGDFDVVRIVLSEAESALRHVIIQPGKPQGWARWAVGDRSVPVIALPGNPLSAAISYTLFVQPMIEKLLGQTSTVKWGMAKAAEAWRAPAGRRQVIPVSLEASPSGTIWARPAHKHGAASHMVSTLANADALAFVPLEADGVQENDVLTIRYLP